MGLGRMGAMGLIGAGRGSELGGVGEEQGLGQGLLTSAHTAALTDAITSVIGTSREVVVAAQARGARIALVVDLVVVGIVVVVVVVESW